MYSKPMIYNLALDALLLQRRITDVDTDKSNECKVLNTHYDVAFRATLEDLDLDSTATQKDLELVEEDPNDLWLYAYKYPSDCVFLRRIVSCVTMDTRDTQLKKRTGILDGEKVIFANTEQAVAEYISKDTPLSKLVANVGICISYKLAFLSSSLIVGKGAEKLRLDIMNRYVVLKADAQAQDRRENFNFDSDTEQSEWVAERMK